MMELQIKMPDPRPCIVYGKRKALLHLFFVYTWTHGESAMIGGFPAGQESKPVALVEYPDGSIETVYAGGVQMLDSDEVFKHYSFEEESK